MSYEAQVKEQSERIVDLLMSDDDSFVKEAAQDLSEYTRIQNREGSITPKIIEPSDFDASRLVPQLDSDQPVMYFEYEQSSPFAYAVDYGTTPSQFIPRGRRYWLAFNQVQTREVVYNILELQTWGQDVRAIMGDNMTKDLIALRDYRFIRACNEIMGPKNTPLPWVGKPMNIDVGSPITHSSFARAKNHIRDTEFSLEPAKVLMNHLRKVDFDVLGVEEFQGHDKSVDIAFKGFSEAEYSGMQLLFTIKKKLVPGGRTHWFADQDFLGRYVQWIPPTMVVKKETTSIRFHLYEVFGITIAHPGALGGQDFIG